jgi:hypothetical protein
MCVLGLLLCPAASFAQARIWGEVGHQTVRMGDGQGQDGRGYGAGLDLTLGEGSTRRGGLVLALGDEMRAGHDVKYMDNLTFVDLNVRVKRVTFGPGVNFVFIDRPDALDSRCQLSGTALQQFQQNIAALGTTPTCVNYVIGTRGMGAISGLAPSGNIRVRFGPRGRGFIQARLIVFSSSTAKVEDKRSPPSTLYPDLDQAWDGRVSAGYRFGHTFVRVTYAAREFTFLRQFSNNNDMFNESERQFTVGAGLAF